MTTKQILKTVAREGYCPYGQARRVAFSIGGKWAFMVTPTCNFDPGRGPGFLTYTTVP